MTASEKVSFAATLKKEHLLASHDLPSGVSPCPWCNQQLNTRELRQHMSTAHGSKMPFVCHLCSKGFLSQSGLNHHVLAHQGRKFSCSICDTKFKQKAHLKNHLQQVHKLAQCHTCFAMLAYGSEYNQHVLVCK